MAQGCVKLTIKSNQGRGWGFSSVVERLPRKRKALGSVPSSEGGTKKKAWYVLWFALELYVF